PPPPYLSIRTLKETYAPSLYSDGGRPPVPNHCLALGDAPEVESEPVGVGVGAQEPIREDRSLRCDKASSPPEMVLQKQPDKNGSNQRHEGKSHPGDVVRKGDPCLPQPGGSQNKQQQIAGITRERT